MIAQIDPVLSYITRTNITMLSSNAIQVSVYRETNTSQYRKFYTVTSTNVVHDYDALVTKVHDLEIRLYILTFLICAVIGWWLGSRPKPSDSPSLHESSESPSLPKHHSEPPCK